ncbi:MAG: SDR family oxidoreductase [Polyangiaceae bacterium]
MKRALVTGAATRVGRSIALELARAGYDLAIHYRSSDSAAAATAEEVRAVGTRAVTVSADLREAPACRKVVEESVRALGGLELLVPSAAEFVRTPLDEVDEERWQRALELNLSSALWLSLAAAPHLKTSHGCIVFITCSSATAPFRNYLPYVVAKGGLRQLMSTLALELAPEVRVNAVAPGTVLPPPQMSGEAAARLTQSTPLGRVGTPEDVARAVRYLAEASYVTGEEIRVDGGRALARVERFDT